MTKRELIEALEESDAPDDTEVWIDAPYGGGYVGEVSVDSSGDIVLELPE